MVNPRNNIDWAAELGSAPNIVPAQFVVPGLEGALDPDVINADFYNDDSDAENFVWPPPPLPSRESEESNNSEESDELPLVFVRLERIGACLATGCTTLNLYNLEMEELPARVPDSVTELILDVNMLTTIPPLPPGIKILKCRSNDFKSASIVSDTLEELYIGDNWDLRVIELTTPNLKVFVCNNCNLKSISTPLPASLITLNVSYNSLENLPPFPPTLQAAECYGNPHLPEYYKNTTDAAVIRAAQEAHSGGARRKKASVTKNRRKRATRGTKKAPLSNGSRA